MHRLTVAVSLLLLSLSVRANPPPGPDWAVEGEWVDTCTCAVPCPCWNEKPTLPTHEDCPDLQYFHVTKGHYGAVSLDGLDVVQVAISADREPFDQSADAKHMKLNDFYLPKSASPAVAAAAEKIFTRLSYVPLDAAKKHAVKRVEIRAALAGGTLALAIPGVLDVVVRQVKDQKGQPRKFPHDVTVVPYFSPALQGRSSKYRFSDDGFQVNVKDRNGTFAHFAWGSRRGPLPWEPGYHPAK